MRARARARARARVSVRARTRARARARAWLRVRARARARARARVRVRVRVRGAVARRGVALPREHRPGDLAHPVVGVRPLRARGVALRLQRVLLPALQGLQVWGEAEVEVEADHE